jgi:hypothetical protein
MFTRFRGGGKSHALDRVGGGGDTAPLLLVTPGFGTQSSRESAEPVLAVSPEPPDEPGDRRRHDRDQQPGCDHGTNDVPNAGPEVVPTFARGCREPQVRVQKRMVQHRRLFLVVGRQEDPSRNLPLTPRREACSDGRS